MASPPPEHAGAAGLEGLPGLVLDIVIAKAGARPAAALACASTRLRAAVAEDALWRRFCADDFGLLAPLDPADRQLPFFKDRQSKRVIGIGRRRRGSTSLYVLDTLHLPASMSYVTSATSTSVSSFA